MLCLACGAENAIDRAFCRRCNHQLVVAHPSAAPELAELGFAGDSAVSLEEHLLERVSVLEEALRRTTETVGRLASVVSKLERSLLLGQAGIGGVVELLERRGVVEKEECDQAWQNGLTRQVAALERRERFALSRDRIFGDCHEESVLSVLTEAERAFAAFDGDTAMALLERIQQRDGANAALTLFLAETAFAEGDGARALALCDHLLAVDPRHFDALVYSGVVLHERGDLPGAERRLRLAVRRHGDAFLAQFGLGAVLATRGRPRLAVRYLERALELREAPQARFLLGSCLYETGRLEPAIRELRRAVAGDPGLEEAHHLLGLACLDRGWRRRALSCFREAQRLNPQKLRYQDLVRFLTVAPTSPLPPAKGEVATLLAEGEKRLADGDGRTALASLRRALSLAPEHPTVLMTYALACLALDRLSDLETVARKVLELSSEDMLRAAASATLIAALRRSGRLHEGNRLGHELLAGAKSSFAQTIAYYEMAYNLAELEEDLDRALDYARRSLALSPEELQQFPLAALGWVHYKRREYDEAVDCLARSSELGASSTTLTHLGMALLAVGQEERAKGAFRRARRLQPRSGSLEERMMECMRSSSELAARVQGRQKR
ncbi:MAG: tetratricopeptide repeat protein [Holophagales bacterium]|nr:MAG: tetratricopeptide repeat protein [Holophagales bacterium]